MDEFFPWPESRKNIPPSGLPYSRRDVKNKPEGRGDGCEPNRGEEAVSNFFFFWVTIPLESCIREVKEHNIRANCIHPGVMDTRMQEEIRKAGPKAIGTDMFERTKEEGRLHTPEEPANHGRLFQSPLEYGESGAQGTSPSPFRGLPDLL
jgi:hypothetical protein